MSILAALRGFVARLIGSVPRASSRADAELREELASHLEMQIAEHVRRGMPPEEARRQALLAAGGMTIAVEAVRERRGLPAVESILSDLRHALRGFAARPGFALTIVITLAIAIGANSAIFSVVDAIVLHPLPYPDPDRILALSQTRDGEDQGVVDERAYAAWAKSARSVTVAAYTPDRAVFTLHDGPESVTGIDVAPNYFGILGIRPILGRPPVPSEFKLDAPDVVLVSEQLWRRAFGGDSSVVGRTINVNEKPATIIGVLPAYATTSTGPQYWATFRHAPSPPGATYYWYAIGRLNPGATIAQARAELQTLMIAASAPQPVAGAKIMSASPTASGIDPRSPLERNILAHVVTLAESRYGEQRKPVLLLFGTVVILLLIACANVANLALIRASGRRREFAVRLALGAARPRLARMLLTESLLLSVAGGALGLVLAYALIGYFVHLSPASVGNPDGIHLNGVVLAFTSAIAVGSALAFGFAPVMMAGRGDLARALSSGTPRASAGSRQHAIRRLLVIGQLATALVLLTGAALVARSFYRVTSIDLGFRPNGLLSVFVSLPTAKYPEARVAPFVDELLSRTRHLPGVVSAGFGIAPMSGLNGSFSMRDSLGHATPPLDELQAGRGYFESIGARLLAGRTFNDGDKPGSPPVVVVNEALAHRLFPGGDAVGRTMMVPPSKSTIVGIVSNIRPRLEAQPSPLVYPNLDQSGVGRYAFMVVRSNGALAPTEKAIAQIVRSMDASLPAPRIQRLSDVVAKAVAPREFVFVLLAMFAGIAATLAVIGLYGLVARVVIERTREFGIRIALGADPRRVIAAVLRQGVTLAVIGGIIGVGGSLASARLMRSMVYETSVYDRTAFIGATALLVAVSVIASYFPARRATRIDPVIALREE